MHSLEKIELVADALMEHIPSRMYHDPADPTGVKWARNLALTYATIAVTTLNSSRESDV